MTATGPSRRVALFAQALGRLEEALARPEDAIVRDACIQRFEFTFETAWRAIQERARVEGLDCVSPRDCFRTGFRLGLLGQDRRWLAMVEDRNRTTHLYDEETARKVYRALPGYAELLRQLLASLRESERRGGEEGGAPADA
ncbi:MAG TPA: HI0074 family nucleotidyltransferase substrate-binding subunit [Candidatus Tectomicrobia bacterium]|nr:HI0074 family nucleotidyltransferase substrate-binding subunit [Candidatus Tectomicrobia bacterium]